MDNSKKKFTAAAFIMMVSTVVSRIVGYAREALIYNRFGYSNISDAYTIAFTLPDLMYNLILGGALAAALIPILSGYIEKKDEKEGWKVISTFINATILCMLVFCILGMIFTPQMLMFVSDFKVKDYDTQLLTIKLTRILFPSVSFLMLAGICNGVLNSYHRFAAAAFGPIIYNIGGILSLWLVGEKSEIGAIRVAYGVMISAVIYFMFQISVSIRNMKYYKPILRLFDSGFIRMVKIALPSLISASIVQINLIISLRYASSDEASVSIFKSANSTWQMPLGVFGQSLGVAVLPLLSSKFAVGDLDGYKDILKKGLRSILALSIPSAVALGVLSETLMRTLFQFSKNVTEDNVKSAALVLAYFTVALVAQSLIAILGRAFYATNDTKTTLYVSTISLVMNAVLGYVFYYNMGFGVAGLALSYSVSSAFYAVAMMVILGTRMKGLGIKDLAEFGIKVSIASLAMGAVLFVTTLFFKADISGGMIEILHVSEKIANKLNQFFILAVYGSIGSLAYYIVLRLLKVQESEDIKNLLLRKILKKKTA